MPKTEKYKRRMHDARYLMYAQGRRSPRRRRSLTARQVVEQA